MELYTNKTDVAILMSTYNGEKYVMQQINSILDQSCQNFTLYIRDDKSEDSTPEIIERETKGKHNVVVIRGSENIGSKRSFLWLLSSVKSKYYMFSDQDDVWLPDKVSISLNKIIELDRIHNYCKPIIVHADMTLVDGNLKLISDSYWKFCKLPVDMPHKFHLHCHFNYVSGCAMIFNNQARDITLPFINLTLPYHIHHDKVISLLVSKNQGIIYPLHISTSLFRRHGNNETNPLQKNESILKNFQRIIPYILDQYSRYRFYNQLNYGSFFKFMFYKYKTVKLQKKWKRKLV